MTSPEPGLIVPVSENSTEFRKKVEFDLRRWEKLVKEANLKFD